MYTWAMAWLLGLLACTTPTPELAGRPTVADAVVLLAEISTMAVTVGGAIVSEQHVDIDAGGDDRYGFRYQVVDAGGDVLYERSTVGPVLVEAFLEHWSSVSGIDILQSLPTLGRFPLQVPLLDGAAEVRFEVRDARGEYALRGAYDLSRVGDDDRGLDADIVAGTQVLHQGGSPQNRVDIVIVGDGYTRDQLPDFADDAQRVADRILGAEPLEALAAQLNIVRVDAVSEESGASYDCPTCGVRQTAFGSIFAIELVNRISGSAYDSRALFQADQWRVAGAVSHVPWDMVIVLVNSEQYGGMAVHYAAATSGQPDFAQVAVHELGHTLGLLGDEYVFDDCIRSDALGLPENVTDRPRDPPWAHWVGDDGVDAFEGAWNCPDLYRPARSCKMRDYGAFCAVCQELLARRVLRHSDPLDALEVEDGALVARGPLLSDVTLRWRVDGAEVGAGPASQGVPLRGLRGGTLEVDATLGLDAVRDDHGDLTETWAFSLD